MKQEAHTSNRKVKWGRLHLTGKENKQIAKIKEKIQLLQSQIIEITDGNQNDDTCDNIDNSNP